jgi:hypothetical protein
MLSWIASGYFAQSPVLVLPVVAMILFMVVFTASALRALRTKKTELDHLANLPFEREEEARHV